MYGIDVKVWNFKLQNFLPMLSIAKLCPLYFRLSSWTTLVRSLTDMRPCSIATQLTLPASSSSCKRRSTVVLVRSWKTSPSTSSLVMPPWLTWSPRSRCVSRLSPTTLLWDVSPCVTWGRPSPSVSSSPSPRRKPPVARSPRLLRRPRVRRSEGRGTPQSVTQPPNYSRTTQMHLTRKSTSSTILCSAHNKHAQAILPDS